MNRIILLHFGGSVIEQFGSVTEQLDTEPNNVANAVTSISRFHNVMVPIIILLLT
jgi:hypothetical protein